MKWKSYEKLSFYLHNLSILAGEVSDEKIRQTLPISVKKKNCGINERGKKIKVKRRKNFRGSYYIMPSFFS